ncbi:hypothetical protein [Salana multivorans]
MTCSSSSPRRPRGCPASSRHASARLLREQSDEVVGMTVAQVAAAAGVSRATVLRVCPSLGYTGYPDLRGRFHPGAVASRPRARASRCGPGFRA